MGGPAIRRGRALFFTIDRDAIQLLEAMVPHPRARGAFFSELVRREARERASRDSLIEALIYGRKRADEQT